VNGKTKDAKRKECKQSFLPMSTTLFASQGLREKREKRSS
jgi:hypothetical protein